MRNLNKKTTIILGIAIVVLITIITTTVFILEKENKQKETTVKKSKENLEENFINYFTSNIPDDLSDKVYVSQNFENELLGKYKINVNIPMIKIKTDTTKKINSEISDIFVKKLISIIQSLDSTYKIYNIDFFANQNGNILTLAIKCTLKEGKNAQRIIIKTYNYDISMDKTLTLEELLQIKNIDIEETQKAIDEKIEQKIEKAEKAKTSGYNVFERTINDNMYEIKNVSEFMIDSEGNIYIIFPYGNNNITSEIDLLVI